MSDEWMDDEQRARLIEELIAWAEDPNALDWDYVELQRCKGKGTRFARAVLGLDQDAPS